MYLIRILKSLRSSVYHTACQYDGYAISIKNKEHQDFKKDIRDNIHVIMIKCYIILN